MVDYDPWSGNYLDTVVENNNIIGGFATDKPTDSNDDEGTNSEGAFIK